MLGFFHSSQTAAMQLTTTEHNTFESEPKEINVKLIADSTGSDTIKYH
jgi:hypothetical protein